MQFKQAVKKTYGEVVTLLEKGWTYREVAQKTSVNVSHVSLIAEIVGIKRKPGRPRKGSRNKEKL